MRIEEPDFFLLVICRFISLTFNNFESCLYTSNVPNFFCPFIIKAKINDCIDSPS